LYNNYKIYHNQNENNSLYILLDIK